jgi:hypothetical protein
MVHVTTLGAERSTLPAERLGSHKWNFKIQIAQMVVLRRQLLSFGILLVISAWGWRCIIVEQEARSQEVQYTILNCVYCRSVIFFVFFYNALLTVVIKK